MESGSYISNVQEDSASIREQLTLSTPAAVSFALGNNSGRGWEGEFYFFAQRYEASEFP